MVELESNFDSKDITVNSIQFGLLKIFPRVCHTSKCRSFVDPSAAVNYPVDILNPLDLFSPPLHKSDLKVVVPILLIRNLNPPKACNETRFAVKMMMLHFTIILPRCGKGEDISYFN